MTDTDKLNLRAQTASVGVALILVVAKLWALAATGALSIAAALADSALDLVMSHGGLLAIRYAQRPPDEDHHFGHTSAEDLAALGQSAFIAVSAIAIATAAIMRLGQPATLANEGAGMAVMALSIALTGTLVLYQTYVGRRTGNRVILADRLHYVSDLLPNLGAIVALFASRAFGLTALDTVIAMVAAVILLFGAARIGSGAWNALMDRAAAPEMIADIDRMATEAEGISGHHDLRTRTAGNRVFINLHVEIDGTLPLSDAHEIGEDLRRAIQDRYPGTDVMIHHDPV